MHKFLLSVCLTCFITAVAGSARAQVRTQAGPTSGAGQPTRSSSAQRGRQQPCWQVAGVSQQVVQQHRQIEENMRSQVEAVCSNSSLTQQQKQQEIRQLREGAKKQVEALVTPQQEQAFRSCISSRAENRSGGTRRASNGGNGGPCGEMSRGNGPSPANTSEPLP